MGKWLESFPYRIDISLWTFIVTGFLSYLMAIGSVGYLSYKAASSNPVEILRNE
jgi:ABC-type lipoprotein release transport system permease subunit